MQSSLWMERCETEGVKQQIWSARLAFSLYWDGTHKRSGNSAIQDLNLRGLLKGLYEVDTQRKRDPCACETLLAEITSSGRLNTAWEAQVLSLLKDTALVDGSRCLKDEIHGWSLSILSPPPAVYVTDRVDLVLKIFKQTWSSSMSLTQAVLLRSRRWLRLTANAAGEKVHGGSNLGMLSNFTLAL